MTITLEETITWSESETLTRELWVHVFRGDPEYFGRWEKATRADLDKALESIELRAVPKDEPDAVTRNSYWHDIVVSLQAERDAAIAAKEAAERNAGDIASEYLGLSNEAALLRPVVEAARVAQQTLHWWRSTVHAKKFISVDGSEQDPNGTHAACAMLDASLRAIDAGEAPRHECEFHHGCVHADDLFKIRDGQENSIATTDIGLAAMRVVRDLRSTLARAEERIEYATGRIVRATSYPDDANLENACEAVERYVEVMNGRVARAEEELQEQLKIKGHMVAEAMSLRSELATIVERAAKAQQMKSTEAAHKASGAAAHYVLTGELITLSTLPEADASGGGGKKP